MSHSERQPRELEDVLRRALRMAADSVEPGADGLDRIRSRISAQRQMPSGWNMVELAGRAGRSSSVLRNLLPVSIAARAAVYAVVQRFRPESDGSIWHRWLRPAAALATGVLVVLAGSWALTVLPQVIVSSGSNGLPRGSGGHVPGASGSGPAAPRTGSPGPGYSGSATYPLRHHGDSSPSASATVPASFSPPAGPTPPQSFLPSASPTPSTSASPSASPTPSPSCSPSASPTPSGNSSRGHRPPCHHRGHHKRR